MFASNLPTFNLRFIDYWLDRFQRMEGIDATTVAGFLEIDSDALAKVAQTFAPRDDRWDEDLELIAARTGVNVRKLADLLRRAGYHTV